MNEKELLKEIAELIERAYRRGVFQGNQMDGITYDMVYNFRYTRDYGFYNIMWPGLNPGPKRGEKVERVLFYPPVANDIESHTPLVAAMRDRNNDIGKILDKRDAQLQGKKLKDCAAYPLN